MPVQFTQEEYDDLELDNYRSRFPVETKGLSNPQIYQIVMTSEDDMDDDEWKALFREAQQHA